jgi:hypothetical protein
MGANATGVQVYIGATTGDLAAGLQQAIGEVRGAVSQMKQQMGGVRAPTEEAGKSVSSLGDKMREFAREQRREAGAARYFVNEFAAFIPEGSKAKDVLGSLTAGLVGGGGFGLAIEAVTLGVKWFTEALKEEEELQKAAAAAAREHAVANIALAAEVDSAARAFYRSAAGYKSTDVDKFVEGATASYRSQVQRLEADYAQKEAYLEILRKQVRANRTKEGEKEVEAKHAELRNLFEQVFDAKQRLRSEEEVARGVAPMVLRDKDRFEGTTAIALAQANVERVKAVGLGEAEVENARYLLELERLRAAQRKAGTPEQQQVVDAQMAAAEAEHRSNLARIEDKKVLARVQREIDLETEAANERGQTTAFADAAAARQKKKALELKEWMREFNAEVTEWERNDLKQRAALYEAWGNRIGAVFADVFTQSTTPLKAMGALLKTALQEMISFAQKRIMVSALEASAEAAKSQAGLPVVGPLLAGGAMVAMLGLVSGLANRLPSAAGGWTIPSGIDPIVQAHGGEHIIPADIARRYEDGAPGGGGVTINVSTMDASTFRDWLRRGAMDEITRELGRLSRDGRV